MTNPKLYAHCSYIGTTGYNNSLNISQITFVKNCIIIKKQTEEEIELNKREYRFKHLI